MCNKNIGFTLKFVFLTEQHCLHFYLISYSTNGAVLIPTLPLFLSVKCSNVISKRTLLYLLQLPSGPKTVLMCILTPKGKNNHLYLKTRNINCIVLYPWCFYFNSLSLLLLFMDKMLKVAKLFIAMSAFLLGMAHGQDGKEPRFFSQ